MSTEIRPSGVPWETGPREIMQFRQDHNLQCLPIALISFPLFLRSWETQMMLGQRVGESQVLRFPTSYTQLCPIMPYEACYLPGLVNSVSYTNGTLKYMIILNKKGPWPKHRAFLLGSPSWSLPFLLSGNLISALFSQHGKKSVFSDIFQDTVSRLHSDSSVSHVSC